MSIARHGSHPIDASRERELRTLLDNPEFSAAVAAYDREDDTHEIPYGGGSATDWRTIFWDHRIVAAIRGGKFLCGGIHNGDAVDPRPTGKVHEAVEGAIIHLWPLVCKVLGWDESGPKYLRAHDLADLAERHAVAHKGWDWDQYQHEWLKLIEPIEKAPVENPPPNLLLDAYQGTPLYAELAKSETDMKMPLNGPSPASAAFAAKYGKGSGASMPSPIATAPEPEGQAMPPMPDAMAHGRAIAGAKALHAVGHINEKERDKHVKASTSALAKAGAKASTSAQPRKPFGSWAQ
jgi:hypothetical protein